MAVPPVSIAKIKGEPVTLFSNPGYGAISAPDKLSDASVDCRAFNAVSVTIYVPDGFTVTATVKGSPDQQGVFLTLPDAQATQTALTASKVFDCTVGQSFVKILLSGITIPANNPANNGIVVIVTPYDAAGQSNISITATASQNLTEVGGAAVALGQHPMADSLPVALPSDQTVPVSVATLPASVGQKAMAASLPVALASDQSSIPVTLPASATQSTIEQKVRAGEAFAWSPGQVTVGASDNLRILISNPSGSGKTLYVYQHALAVDTAALYVASLFRNPSTGLPTLGAAGAGIVNQNGGSATASVAKVGADANATTMAAGTGSQITTESAPGIGRTAYPASLYVVPANSTLGINIPCTAASKPVPEFTWWEE